MVISLIGMSGIGKSYWSKLLVKELDYTRYCCDDLVEKKLSRYDDYPDIKGINAVSHWMGQPYEPQYKGRADKYLECEKEVMTEIFHELENYSRENIIIDTTGSVIYTGKEIMARLKELSSLVHLKVPKEILMHMFKLYVNEPKPVFWGDSFTIKNSETNEDALQRCYPELLLKRESEYSKYADIILDYYKIRESSFTVADFLISVWNR